MYLDGVRGNVSIGVQMCLPVIKLCHSDGVVCPVHAYGTSQPHASYWKGARYKWKLGKSSACTWVFSITRQLF